ncbi:hypothetical protein HY837_04745 [archaeon]|nr:hypothetical protein [archaeon]
MQDLNDWLKYYPNQKTRLRYVYSYEGVGIMYSRGFKDGYERKIREKQNNSIDLTRIDLEILNRLFEAVQGTNLEEKVKTALKEKMRKSKSDHEKSKLIHKINNVGLDLNKLSNYDLEQLLKKIE